MVWAADQKTSPKTKQAYGMLTGTVADGPVSSDPATRREEIHIRALPRGELQSFDFPDSPAPGKLPDWVKTSRLSKNDYLNG